MPKTHDLKIWPEFFADVASGAKTFEFRRDDRNYEVGDVLSLMEYSPEAGAFTGREVEVDVTFVMRSDALSARYIGIPYGYCILGVRLKNLGGAEIGLDVNNRRDVTVMLNTLVPDDAKLAIVVVPSDDGVAQGEPRGSSVLFERADLVLLRSSEGFRVIKAKTGDAVR